MRVLCVGRHSYLANHFAAFFGDLGLETCAAVGVDGAIATARRSAPDVVICDYDLLATLSLERWEREPRLSTVPVVAVSLTRRPDEVHVMDVNGIAGFLYLPTLDSESALRVIAAARPRRSVASPHSMPWSAERPTAQLR